MYILRIAIRKALSRFNGTAGRGNNSGRVYIPLVLMMAVGSIYFIVHRGLGNSAHNTDIRVDAGEGQGLSREDAIDVSRWSNWDKYEEDIQPPSAAVLAPYHIIPGRETKYLLSTIQTVHAMGLSVMVYVHPDNLCQKKEDLLRTAEALRVQLDPSKVEVSQWRPDPPKTRVFITAGSDIHPPLAGTGQVNIYICHFPFTEQPMQQQMEGIPALQTYDYVMLDSRYSSSVYNKAIAPTLNHLLSIGGIFPSFDILYPPVVLMPPAPTETLDRRHIIVFGDFVDGGPKHGHKAALELFLHLKPSLPADTKLLLVGARVAGQADYMESLVEWALRHGLTDSVDFKLLGTQPEKVLISYMHMASVLWHMDGMGTAADQASLKSFDELIVKGMSAGCIPIVMADGPSDVIEHLKSGFVAKSKADYRQYTIDVFKMTHMELAPLRKECMEHAATFSYERFEKSFMRTIHRGILTRPFRYFIANTLPLLRSCALTKKSPPHHEQTARPIVAAKTHAAVIIEGRCHYALEYVILNAMSLLSSGSVHTWVLHVYYTTINAQFVAKIVADHPGLQHHVKLHHTHLSDIDIPAYNHLCKSKALWDQMLPAEKALIFQTDSIILTQGIDRFLSYDYVGAPWHRENERWDVITKNSPEGVGNGGFSLRDVGASRDISIRRGAESSDNEQEDMFFAHHMTLSFNEYSKKKGVEPHRPYIIAPRGPAYNFCLEVTCSDIKVPADHVPMALHAAWYYQPVDKVQKLLDWSLRFILKGTAEGPGGVPMCSIQQE